MPRCATDMPSAERVMPAVPFFAQQRTHRLDQRRDDDPDGRGTADNQQDADAAVNKQRNDDAKYQGNDRRYS